MYTGSKQQFWAGLGQYEAIRGGFYEFLVSVRNLSSETAVKAG